MRACLGTLLAAALMGSAAHAQQDDPSEIARLKSTYLACSDAAAQGRLDTAQIMRCSVVYEQLKLRAFGGDFGRLLAWSRAQRARTAARQ